MDLLIVFLVALGVVSLIWAATVSLLRESYGLQPLRIRRNKQ